MDNIKANKNEGCQCDACCNKYMKHKSDCDVHNEPAYPNSKCTCEVDNSTDGNWEFNVRITDIETLSYFENKEFNTRHGVYKCKFRGETKFYVLTNNTMYVLVHFDEKSSLEITTHSVANEFMDLLGLKVLEKISK